MENLAQKVLPISCLHVAVSLTDEALMKEIFDKDVGTTVTCSQCKGAQFKIGVLIEAEIDVTVTTHLKEKVALLHKTTPNRTIGLKIIECLLCGGKHFTITKEQSNVQNTTTG